MSDGNQPILLKPPYPMLARAGKLEHLAHARSDGYRIEPKIDGIRCMAIVGTIGGQRTIQLFNRQLRNVTSRFPEVVEDMHLKVRTDCLLDGEIYVRGDNGHANFQLVQHRANRVQGIELASMQYPAHFVAFDLLRLDTHWLTGTRGWSLQARQAVLQDIAGQLCIATYTQEEADDLAMRQVGEGLMLKHVSSKYLPGERSPAWIKCKWLRSVECWVGGVTHGIGKRESYFGGLLVGVYMPEDTHGKARLQYIGCVGTGFNDDTLAYLSDVLPSHRTAECPFAQRGADWDVKYFVRPVQKIRVAFSEYTRDGIMRFPRYESMLT
jgi:bifunctional non-homologous end joining protein LigD